MKFMKILLLILLFSVVGFSEVPKLLNKQSVMELSAKSTLAEFPNADEILLEEYTKTVYKADGTSKTYDEIYVKVLTERGKRSNREVSFRYTLPYATVQIECLEIIKPDGTVVSIDIKENSREVVDRGQMSSNIYNPNSKVLQASLPGLEIGDIVHYASFKDTVKARVPNTFSDYSVFEYDLPILRTTYEVVAPADKPLVNIELKDEIDGTVKFSETKEDGKIVYKWSVSNVSKAFPEPSMPALYTVVQRLLVSTIAEWNDISSWYWKLCLPHIEATTPAMETKVEELVSGCSNDYEKITNIFNFVSQDIRYMGITPEKEAPGYEPHDSSMTFENRYGVCRDKATLLVTMLRLAGLEAFPVIINAGPKKDEEVPQPYFNHAVTAVRDKDGRYILMDSTDESTKRLLPAYLSDCSYLVATPKGDPLRTSPIIPASENMMIIKNDGVIDDKGMLTVDTVLQFDGINDNAYRGYFAKQKPEAIKKYFERVLSSSVTGAKLKEFEIKPSNMQDTSIPLSVSLSYSVENYVKGNETVSIIKPPSIGARVGMINFIIGGTNLEKRKYPMKTQVACGVQEFFDIELDKCVGALIEIPDFTNLNSNVMTYSADVKATENSLTGDFLFSMNVVEMSPDEYLEFKKNLKVLEYEERKELLFKSIKGISKDADIEVIYSHRNIELTDSRNWKTNVKMKLKVLTYGGKKQFSEIKIGYNPAWQDVKVESATVTLGDNVKEITDVEMNVMDAGWSGGAPRYPAGKTLVVSLPGVEIGSTVEYEISATHKDKFFFAEDLLFASSNPFKEKSLTIVAPKDCSVNVVADQTDEYKMSETNISDKIQYHFEAKDKLGIVSEQSTPPWWSFKPNVFISTATWQDYAELVKQAVDKKLQSSKSVTSKATELVDGAKNDKEKIIAIRDYILKSIRIAGPSFVDLPLNSLSEPKTTMKDGYGHSLDRAMLMKAMFDDVNIDSEIILAGSCVQEKNLRETRLKYVSPSLLSAALVKLQLDGEAIYLNAGTFYDQLGTSPYDKQVGLTLDGKLFEIKVADEFRDRSESFLELYIGADGTAIYKSTSKYYGTAFGGGKKKFAEMRPEDFRRFYLQILVGLSQSATASAPLTPDFSAYPGSLSYEASIKQYAVVSDNYIYFKNPAGLTSFSASNEPRELPFYYSGNVDLSSKTKIFLPNNTKRVLMVPNELDWTGVFGIGQVKYDVELKTDDKGNKYIEFNQIAKLNPTIIPSDDYKVIQDISSTQRNISDTIIVLEIE
ncbi:MAG: DUF3857 domain-containing protein [Kiritimatiellae bacterium]|jgi:hypothetical protein|nr:DUF3857 domain-containing protein [Kiritimatiellia bacterium]